jgi:hypothetical protein
VQVNIIDNNKWKGCRIAILFSALRIFLLTRAPHYAIIIAENIVDKATILSGSPLYRGVDSCMSPLGYCGKKFVRTAQDEYP